MAGAGAWQSVLTRYVIGHGALRVGLVLGFTQDSPEHYIAPDFGISAGFVTPISAC